MLFKTVGHVVSVHFVRKYLFRLLLLLLLLLLLFVVVVAGVLLAIYV